MVGDVANARKTFSSLTAVYPETKKTESAGLPVDANLMMIQAGFHQGAHA